MTSSSQPAEFLDAPYFPDGMSVPDPDDAINGGYFAAAADRRLVVQRCADCGTRQYPPELNCHACYGFNMEWEESVGTGTVWSWVEVVHPAHPALREFGPYMVALVELDDMPEIKLMGAVVDAPLGGTMKIGARVRVVFERTADDLAQPRWHMA
ncbi:MAG: OB-fold domain-containing protein [Chloroflexota bacterium]|nr:OB-fold domain-containing protein [Chloroflexota bacterium]